MLINKISSQDLKDLYIVWSEYDECFDIKVRDNSISKGNDDGDYIIGKIYEEQEDHPLADFIRQAILQATSKEEQR